MRWHGTVEGTIRTKSMFLIFPFTIGRETRWLERVTIKQIYNIYGNWRAIEFLK